MAHKGVVGAVALGLGLYSANEWRKDWEVENERKKREQEEQDYRDELMRRLEESERRSGSRSAAAYQAEMENLFLDRDFQVRVFSHLDQLLYGLVVRVGEEGTPLRNSNLQLLDLPLLSNEYDKEDLMLAAAFALGDSDIVGRVIKTFKKQTLGIGLKKFTSTSIRNIIAILESVENPDISHKDLTLFISRCVYSPDFRSERPVLRMLGNGHSYSQNLQRWGESFNVHVIHARLLNWKRTDFARQKMKFGYYRSMEQAEKNRQEKGERNEWNGSVILSNFHCPFEASFDLDRENGTISSSFGDIRVTGRNHNMRTPDVDAISTAFARKIAAGVAQAAAARLRVILSLKSHEDGISHEHICVQSGCSSDLLRVLREQDMHMIATHEEKISATLLAMLKHNVPPPDQKTVKQGESPNTQLDREILLFVASYIKLVHLAYCEVPLLAGKPPSSFVPKYSVHDAALRTKDCFWKAEPLMIRARTRSLQKEEQERLVLSRDLVAPGKAASFVFAASAWVLSSWLCTAATKTGLDSLFPLHSFLALFAVSQVFNMWMLHSLVVVFKTKVFGLSDDSSWLVTVSYCTEYIQRCLAAKSGKPTPYDQEMCRLKAVCKAQYRRWKLRIAKREFRTALKRKRITCRESMLLLTDFADNYYETADEEIVKGVVPAPLSEAEKFLKLKVEEQLPYDEIGISPDETIKNNLQNDERSGCQLLSIEALGELSAKVRECVDFCEGDRVVVKLEEEDLNGLGTQSPTSTCTDLSTVVRGTQTGSVVFCTATLCFVHFDGGSTMIPVPIRCCSILDENPIPDMNSSSEASDNNGEIEVESEGEESVDAVDAETDGGERAHAAPHAQKKARTVEEALVDGGWEFERCKKHIKYSRRVKLSDGSLRKQTVSVSKTPSDWRAERNALAVLRRLDEDGVVEVVSEETPSIICSVCHKMKKQDSDFSKSQLKKGANMKCKDCVSKL